MNKTIAVIILMSGALLTTATAEEKGFPPPNLVGTWHGNVEIFGPFKVEPYPSQAREDHQEVVVAIAPSGMVAGHIGQAVFKECTIRRNRSWLGRALHVKSDFIVVGGYMEGRVTPRDEGGRRRFTIPLNIENGRLKGTIMLLPEFPLTRFLDLERNK